MVKFDVKDLKDAVYRIGNLEKRDLILLVWTDKTPSNAPVVRPMRLTIPDTMKQANDVVNAINGIVPIMAIIDEHKNIYHLKDANEVAKKECEVGIVKDVKSKNKKT